MISRLLRRRLYLRIYAAVLASLAAFTLLAALAWQLWPRDEEPRPGLRALSAWFVAELLPPDASAETLAASLERWRERSGVDLALVDAGGRVLAAAGAPLPALPPGPPRPSDARGERGSGGRELLRRDGAPPVLVVRLPDGRALLASLPRRARPPWAGLGFAFPAALIALAVGVGAYPVARRLTRRLEALQLGVERLGEGDLSARATVAGDDEVARLAASFNRSAERIETLVRSHKALLANASHELRSPLARIRVGVELLGPSAPAALRDELARSVAELDALVDEILLAGRLDAVDPRAARGEFEDVDLAALAAEECARAGAAFELAPAAPADARAAPAAAGSAAAAGGDATMRADPRLLRRLLRNLLENAARHAAGAPAEAALRVVGPVLELSVADRGPGVAAAERERIFEPFYRARGASERSGGVGLGLSLVRQIARHHGGEVECLPREGGGSVFRVRLPRDGAQAAAPAASAAQGASDA